MLAKPETTLATEKGRMPLLAKPETPLPRLEKPEDSPPKFWKPEPPNNPAGLVLNQPDSAEPLLPNPELPPAPELKKPDEGAVLELK
nr:hypothetical protein [Mycobacterium canetti]